MILDYYTRLHVENIVDMQYSGDAFESPMGFFKMVEQVGYFAKEFLNVNTTQAGSDNTTQAGSDIILIKSIAGN